MAENTNQSDNKLQSTIMNNQQSEQYTILNQQHPIKDSTIMPHQDEERKSQSSGSQKQEESKQKMSSLVPRNSQPRSGQISVEGSISIIAALNRLLPPCYKLHLPNLLPGTLHQSRSRPAANRGFSGQKANKKKKVMKSTLMQSMSEMSQNQDEFENPNRPQEKIKRSNREKKPNPKHDLGYIQPRAQMGQNLSQGNPRKFVQNKVPTQQYKKCEKIFSSVKKHKLSGPFLYPVDPQYFQIPDYFDVIKEPMDLGTVEARLK